MTDQLARIAATYAESRNRLHALVDGIDDDVFNAKPSAGSWSAGECVVHLNKIAKGYVPALEAALQPDGPKGTGPYRWGWVARQFIGRLTPGTSPIPTAPAMKPPTTQGLRSDIDRQRVLARFDADTDRWIALCERADGLDLSRIRVRSPFLPVMKLQAGAFLEALGVHALRHVGQAERAVAAATG